MVHAQNPKVETGDPWGSVTSKARLVMTERHCIKKETKRNLKNASALTGVPTPHQHTQLHPRLPTHMGVKKRGDSLEFWSHVTGSPG